MLCMMSNGVLIVVLLLVLKEKPLANLVKHPNRLCYYGFLMSWLAMRGVKFNPSKLSHFYAFMVLCKGFSAPIGCLFKRIRWPFTRCLFFKHMWSVIMYEHELTTNRQNMKLKVVWESKLQGPPYYKPGDHLSNGLLLVSVIQSHQNCIALLELCGWWYCSQWL